MIRANIGKDCELAKKFDIEKLPTFIVFEEQEEVSRYTGIRTEVIEELVIKSIHPIVIVVSVRY